MSKNPQEFSRRAFALLVGISEFKDQNFRGRPLPIAANDIELVKILLCRHLGWREANCRVVKGVVDKVSLIEAFNYHIKAARADGDPSLFLLYLSTHGQFFDEEGISPTGVLLTSDTTLENLPTALETGVSSQFLSGFMRETRAVQKLIISDACFSGTVSSAASLTPLNFYKPIDAAVLASSRMESFAHPQSPNSLFTQSLFDVLQATQGSVALPTFFQRLSEEVRARANGLGKDQEPVLSHQGGVIVLGYIGVGGGPVTSVTYSQIQQFCASILQDQLSRRNLETHGPEGGYVSRQATEDRFWQFVAHPGTARAFTVVGAAGTGKSTTMAHLAQQAAERGHAVLWIPENIEGQGDPAVPIQRVFERIDPSLTLQRVVQSLPESNPLLVFFDAINEWPTSFPAITEFFARAFALPASPWLRFVVSCRANAWDDLGSPFTKDRTFFPGEGTSKTVVASAYLTVFSDEELATAIKLHERVKQLATGELARQPLFLRVVSTLGDHISESAMVRLSYLDLFEQYLRVRARKIAQRLVVITPEEIIADIDRVVFAIAESGSESLSRAAYFEILPEALAVSLLDEGLFKYTGEEVTVEAEVVHEHLLSRILPEHMFASQQVFQQLLARYRLAAGAVVFRMCGMTDHSRVLQAMRWLDLTHPFAILDALDRLPVLSPYWSFFEEWFRGESQFRWMAADALTRRVDRDFDFCFEAARVLFLNENYYPWETKRWRDVPYRQFRQRVDREGGGPALLAQCIEQNPQTALRRLIQEWLLDETPLRGGSGGLASIGQTAQIYISEFGQRFPALVFREMSNILENSTFADFVDRILGQLAHMVPRETAEGIAGWTETAAGAFRVLTVINQLPPQESQEALRLARALLRHDYGNPNLTESIIAAMARYGTREALALVESHQDDPNLVRGIIVALTRLHHVFPEECERIAGEVCWRTDLSDDAVTYACTFYDTAATRNPEIALTFLQHAARMDRAAVSQSVSYSLITLVKSQNPGFRALVEERLSVERDYTSLFNYVIAVEQFRELHYDDLVWLKRWIGFPAFREDEFLWELLLASSISLKDITDIAFSLERMPSSPDSLKPGPRLTALAQSIVQDQRVASLRHYPRRFWELVAQGQTPEKAAGIAKDEYLRIKRPDQ